MLSVVIVYLLVENAKKICHERCRVSFFIRIDVMSQSRGGKHHTENDQQRQATKKFPHRRRLERRSRASCSREHRSDSSNNCHSLIQPGFPRQKPPPPNQQARSDHSLSDYTPLSHSTVQLWEDLLDRVGEWIKLYEQNGVIFCKMKEALLAENLIESGEESLRVSQISPNTWLRGKGTKEGDYESILTTALQKLEKGLNILNSKPTSTNPDPQLADPFTVQARVNGISVNLSFKNSGNNDINDIEVYLQEKLDVLEFIQMDCNKMEMTQFPSTRSLKAMGKEEAPQSDQSSLSVADWYTNQASTSIHISQGDSFIESVHVPIHRSQLKELAEDGFFIGTPTSREQILLDQSNLDWETSSIISSSSTRRKGRKQSSSRNRSLSSCSVSSVEDSRLQKPPPQGMFGRGRMARIAANISGLYDENDQIGSGNPWWESGYQ
jgi:hypothetical protein